VQKTALGIKLIDYAVFQGIFQANSGQNQINTPIFSPNNQFLKQNRKELL
jgi:hypothetical protein